MQVLLFGHVLTTFAYLALLVADLHILLLGTSCAGLATAAYGAALSARFLVTLHHGGVLMAGTALVSLLFHLIRNVFTISCCRKKL